MQEVMSMMSETSRQPSADRPYWLYDPEGVGMVYYQTQEARDAAAQAAIRRYVTEPDGWSEDVEFVAAGILTHSAQCLAKEHRPAELDEDGCDADGMYWEEGVEWFGSYTLEPVGSSS